MDASEVGVLNPGSTHQFLIEIDRQWASGLPVSVDQGYIGVRGFGRE